MAETSDEILMQRVKDGNIAELSVLFERYNIRLYNFFIRMGAERNSSQDLTQNLFYRMIKYRNTYNEGYSVKSWMFRMARNLYYDHRKTEDRSGEMIMACETYPTDMSDGEDGFYEEDFERLEHAFSALTDEQRELIVLSRFQGLKYEEISTITNQSVPAIKVAMHRAIKQLRSVYFKLV